MKVSHEYLVNVATDKLQFHSRTHDDRRSGHYRLCLQNTQVTPSYIASALVTFAFVPTAASRSNPVPSNAPRLILLQR